MYCIKCGATINHNGNIHTISWHDREADTNIQKKEIYLLSNKIPVSSMVKIAIWAALVIPALLMPYIFKLSFEKYRNMDSILLDVILSLIVFSAFYFTKKALYDPKHKR